MIRNTDPGSNAGIAGLSLFAGMTTSGLPIGLESGLSEVTPSCSDLDAQ
jgi:hypothetical protein